MARDRQQRHGPTRQIVGRQQAADVGREAGPVVDCLRWDEHHGACLDTDAADSGVEADG